MSVIEQPPAGGENGSPPPAESSVLTAAAGQDVPARAAGLELLGEMRGSGYRSAPALVRRHDGQMVQLTSLLYLVLESVDGHRNYDEIAAAVSAKVGRRLAPDDARMLVDEKLRPLGLLRGVDGSEPDVPKANPLLALRFKWVVSNPRVTRRITAPFAWLFHPLLVVAAVVAFVLVCKWVLFEHGLGFAAHEAFHSPGMLLAVFAITVVSAGFHEFGHAAAARYGGATPGAMGAGLYLVWPAFYTDVTDSYRLGRGGRLRTDLGGLYFNALLAVAVFGVWAVTGWDAVLLVVATQVLQMVRQLPPLVRFDGYHILADLTGVPDLFHRIKPTVKGLWPTRWRSPESRVLRPWARLVVTVWVLLVVPLMVLTVLVTVVAMPRIVASSAVSLHEQWTRMVDGFGRGELATGFAALLGVVAVAIPLLGIAYIVTRSVRRLTGAVLRSTKGRPVRRTLAAMVAAAVVAGLVYAWWPHGNYRPIRAYEPGTVQSALPASYTSATAGLAEGRQGSAQTIWPSDAGPVPDADHPVLSLVLVPRTPTPEGTPAPTWVFPFNRPAPPGVGDNQSLAVNTTDGTVVYDVAFALVWADSDTVLNKNEAYAFASCTDCAAVAVSFQVVLIVGHADVVVPQNIAAAVNYECLRCVSSALAVQLVLTLPEHPSADEQRALDAVWDEVRAFSAHVVGLSYSEIHDRIAGFERRITAIVEQYAPPEAPGDPRTSSSVPPGSATPGSGSGSAGVSEVNGASPTTSSSSLTSSSATSSSPSPTSSASVPESSTVASTTASTSSAVSSTAASTTAAPSSSAG